MQRAVGGRVCQVGKEGAAVPAALFDELDNLVGVSLGGIEILGQFIYGFPILGIRHSWYLPFNVPRVVKVAAAADKQREITLETASVRNLIRFKTQMPFPGHICVVAVVTQQLGDRSHTRVEYALISGFSHLVRSGQLRHITQAGNVVVRSAEQHGPGNRAGWRHVEVGEAHSLLRQPVQYRRVDLAAVTSQVRVTQIIGNNKEDIGPLVLLRRLQPILCMRLHRA